jgi:hypothetical protein
VKEREFKYLKGFKWEMFGKKERKDGEKYLNRPSAEIGSRCANHWMKKYESS